MAGSYPKNRRPGARHGVLWILVLSLVILLSGCTQTAESCPVASITDLSGMGDYFENDAYPFQFPLENRTIFASYSPLMTVFAKYGITTRGPEYHAAEDIEQPAGTPVYAMADGRVSFSGRMGGYGWLVIVDHPQSNLYSLYGHLSPSRWQIEQGPVKKGELVGYLGDSDENGGTKKNPMRPHLHFGVRAGQRADYSSQGQWRWQAGWIKPCPQDLGWLQPSLVISAQDIHYGEGKQPTASPITRWGPDLLFVGIYLFGGACMLVYSLKQKKPTVLITSSAALFVAGWIFYSKGMFGSCLIFGMSALLLGIGIYTLIPWLKSRSAKESK